MIPEELVGKICYEVFLGRDSPCPECPAQKALKTGKVEHTVLTRLQEGEREEKKYLDSYAVPIKNESGEIVNIMHITRDITERVQAEERIRESEQNFRELAEKSPLGVVIADEKTNQLYVNKRYAEITGYSTDELIGMNAFEVLTRPKDRRKYSEWMKKRMKGEPHKEEYERILLRKDGIEVQTEFFTTKTKWKGEMGAMAIVQDITARKQAEAKIKQSLREKEVLLKEVHHRVKNNLQVIASLLSLQSGHITDKASRTMFEESQNRVRSMALIHEKLYQSDDMARIDIAKYVRDLTASLFSTYTVGNEIKVNIAITDIFFTITTAIPCGLLINELVTNALKHAFPHQQDGTITVSMTPSNKDSLILTVSDTGIGFPEGINFNNTATLGMQLVTSLVEQLDGTITLDRNEGTTFIITFRGGVE